MKINDETSGARKGVEEIFQVGNMLRDGTNDNEHVISVLQNGAREIIHERVK